MNVAYVWKFYIDGDDVFMCLRYFFDYVWFYVVFVMCFGYVCCGVWRS